MDELMVVFSFILFSVILFYSGRVNRDGAKILICLSILGGVGIVSGLINNNPLWVTITGVFDYMKNFLVVPLFAILSVEYSTMGS